MTRIWKCMAAASAAATLMGAAGAASATNYTLTLVPTGGGNLTSTVGASVTGASGSSFQDVFTFTLGAPGTANSTLTTILLSGVNNINFTTVLLDGVVPFSVVNGGSSPDQATLSPTAVGTGPHTITVNGTIAAGSGGGSYGGALNIGPIPEPATWAMMIVGMGMVGFGLRMRRRTAAAVA